MMYNVKWIRYGEAVLNMFISDMKFLNMEHINAKYSTSKSCGGKRKKFFCRGWQ
jgi:hypothetical protein